MMKRQLPRRKASTISFRLVILLLFLLLGVGLFFWYRKNGKFGVFDRFNLVIEGNPVTVVSVDQKEHTVTAIKMPDDLYISEVVPNYGSYKISSVYKVGELDKRGGQVLAWTISDYLGIPIDGYLITGQNLNAAVKKLFLNPKIVFGRASNINFFDRTRIVFAVEQARFDKTYEVDLKKLAAPLVLADGTTALVIEKEKLDDLLAGYFIEPSVRDEDKRVAVINSTAVTGLGNRTARVLTNIGVTVVDVGSKSEDLSRCEVRTAKKYLTLWTTRRIAQVFSCEIVTTGDEERAQVTIVLGQDFAAKFEKL